MDPTPDPGKSAAADAAALEPPAAGRNGNGNAQTVRWIVGILGSGVLALLGGTLTTLRLDSERIAAAEQRLTNLERQLDRMDEKLDRLLEKGSGRP
jgi:hypothetical protein